MEGAMKHPFTLILEAQMAYLTWFYKMTSVAAAVGRVQLKKLDRLNAKRHALAMLYDDMLQEIPGVKLRTRYDLAESSHHLYNFFLTPESGINRDALIHEIATRYHMHYVHRFWPIHLHSVLRMQGHRMGEAPVYERLWFSELVSLPLAPSMTRADVRWIAKRILKACTSLRRKG